MRNENVIIGIDPGLTGGLAVLASEKLIYAAPLPRKGVTLDLRKITDEITSYKPREVYLELVGARPGQGVASMFKFGRVFGMLEGVLAASGISYTLVHPLRWARAVHGRKRPNGVDTKVFNTERAHELWPGFDFRANSRCRVAHLGMVDAALIGYYGHLVGG